LNEFCVGEVRLVCVWDGCGIFFEIISKNYIIKKFHDETGIKMADICGDYGILDHHVVSTDQELSFFLELADWKEEFLEPLFDVYRKALGDKLQEIGKENEIYPKKWLSSFTIVDIASNEGNYFMAFINKVAPEYKKEGEPIPIYVEPKLILPRKEGNETVIMKLMPFAYNPPEVKEEEGKNIILEV
jgi:hypothetical protein